MTEFRYRDHQLATKIITRLKNWNLKLRLMHVCGTHQDTLVRYGLESLLATTGVEIRQGPGCPVCVTTPYELMEAITLAKHGKTIAVYGDITRVPAPPDGKSLWDIHAEGCDIKIVYGVDDAVKLAEVKPEREVIFLSIGFETTAPSVAYAILSSPPENFSILSCHKLIPPALRLLLELGEVKLQGLIEPGHVSTIIGVKPYEFISARYSIPQVIAGFEPLDLLMAVYMIAKQYRNGEAKVENEYRRSVKYEGNPKAIKIMYDVFDIRDAYWRGFPLIPNSGLELKAEFELHNARCRYEDLLSELKAEYPQEELFGAVKTSSGCRCGELLRGVINPEDCPLFGKACRPDHPVGPCMVSIEGGCNIAYKYGRTEKKE